MLAGCTTTSGDIDWYATGEAAIYYYEEESSDSSWGEENYYCEDEEEDLGESVIGAVLTGLFDIAFND